MTRWQIFRITDDDIRYRLRALTARERPSFIALDARLISLGDKASELQLADGRRLNFPTRALRQDMGTIIFSKQALRLRGLHQ